MVNLMNIYVVIDFCHLSLNAESFCLVCNGAYYCQLTYQEAPIEIEKV